MPLDSEAVKGLKSSISAARKKEMNFALCMGKKPEGTVLILDRIKEPGVLYKKAKSAGETPKMASGRFWVEGSKAFLSCLEEPPAGCGRRLKQFFSKTVGVKLKVNILDANGSLVEGDEEDEEAPQDTAEPTAPAKDPELAKWEETFEKLDPVVKKFVNAGQGDVEAIQKEWAQICDYANRGRNYATALERSAKIPALLKNAVKGEEDPAPAPDQGGTPPPQAPETGIDEKLLQELKDQMAALVPKVKDMVAKNAKGADKLVDALKAAAANINAGALDSAKKTLDIIKKVTDASVPDIEDTRRKLAMEYDAIVGKLDTLKAEAEDGIANKAAQIQKMYGGLINGEDMQKVAALLKAAKTFAEMETAKLAEQGKSLFDTLGEAVSDLVEDGKELVDDALEGAKDVLGEIKETLEDVAEDLEEKLEEVVDYIDDTVDSLTEDGRKKLDLQELGFSEEEQDRIVGSLGDNPNAIKEAKEKLVDDTNLPDKQKEVLKKLAENDPKAFAAAMNTLKGLDPDGSLDASPGEVQKSAEDLETARKAFAKSIEDMKAANTALDGIKAGTPPPGSDWANAVAASAAAEKAFKDFSDNLPDPKTMTEEQRIAAMHKANELDAARRAAAKAVEKEKAAALEAAEKAVADANTAMEKAKGDQAAMQKALDEKEAKRGLLDALTFGRLSPDAKPAFKSEDKTAFIEAFGKDGKLARSAMDLAARSPDPSVVAQNVGFVADKMNDGFAAENGDKLDMSPEDMREMANNALRMGAMQGQEYFDGFEAYLKTGDQLKPDPHGGLDEPLDDPKAERQRKNKIALNRTSGLGDAALDENGKVDFSSPEAKAAMDHVMFHPGSLKTFTPQLNAKMTEVKDLFAHDENGPKAQTIIDGTKLPANGAPGKVTAQKLVAGTMGKTKDTVDDNDAKAAVLSAMMTPLSQGPVGSCFSTAPVRAVRETDPLRAMGEYSKIATTGQYTAKSGKVYPANLNPPKGENPLMRSWEYSVATAAGEMVSSRERKKMSGAVLSRSTLGGIKDIVPADEWRSSTDPTTGMKVPGVRAKLRKAIAQKLKFEYNAGPPVGTPPSGGGDGSSTDGGYEIKYKGTALKSQADFVSAMKEIGLTAAGYAEGTTEGDAIVALVESQPFITSILNAYGPAPTNPGDTRAAPWNLSGGGFEDQTDKVLDGGNPTIQRIQGAKGGTPPPTQTQRTVQLLGTFLGQTGPGKKDMEMLSTRGTNANHAFNGLPNHPSLDKIKDPNSGAKIQSELIDPGVTAANTAIPADKVARMYDDQIKAFADGAPQDERDLLIAALKKRPTTALKPAELKTKIEAELAAYRDAAAQKRADKWLAANEPSANAGRKTYVLNFFKDRVDEDISAAVDTELMNSMQMPEVVVADSNWGGPEGQTLFVVSPDPTTGDLKMWKKDAYTGKLTPLGQNWEDAKWYKVD